MMDYQPKEFTVARYIAHFKEQGVAIHQPASHYVPLIDEMVRNNPTLLKQPFEDVMRLAAIAEYDFNNGQNPDTMARRVLGDELYQKNKERLGR